MERNFSEVQQNEIVHMEAGDAPAHMNKDTKGAAAVGADEQPAAKVKANGKGKTKAGKKGTAKDARDMYADLGINDPERIRFLDDAVKRWHESEKMDAKIVFVRAEIVGTSEHLWESQEQMERWADTCLGVSRRHANNYGRVYKDLGHLAERFIAARVTPSVIYKLPGAPIEKVEAVLSEFEAGRRLKVKEAEVFVRQEGEEIASEGVEVELPGADGIRKMSAQKVKDTVPRIIEGHQILLAACFGALDDYHRGVRVKKGELERKVSHLAWVVREMLENLSFSISPRSDRKPWAMNLAKPEPEMSWAHVDKQLALLSDGVEWPDAIGPWLIDEVIPALEWGLGPKLAKAVRDADERRLAEVATAKVTAKAAAKAASKKVAKAERAAAKSTKAKSAKSPPASAEVAVPATPAEPAAPVEQVVAPALVVPEVVTGEVPETAPSAGAPKGPKAAKAKRPIRPTLNDGLAVIAKAGGLTT